MAKRRNARARETVGDLRSAARCGVVGELAPGEEGGESAAGEDREERDASGD